MNDGTTPLILAARLAVEGMVAELINCQADVNAVDDHGRDEKQGFRFPPAKQASEEDGCTILNELSQIRIHWRFIQSFILPFTILSSEIWDSGRSVDEAGKGFLVRVLRSQSGSMEGYPVYVPRHTTLGMRMWEPTSLWRWGLWDILTMHSGM